METIKIFWNESGSDVEVLSSISLSDEQILSIRSIPPYFDEIEMVVEKDGHHIQVTDCIGKTDDITTVLTAKRFDELIYEALYRDDLEWLINRITYKDDVEYYTDFLQIKELTDKEKFDMYMKVPHEELVRMKIEEEKYVKMMDDFIDRNNLRITFSNGKN